MRRALLLILGFTAFPVFASDWGSLETMTVNKVVFEGHTKAWLFPKRCSVVLTQDIWRLCGMGSPIPEKLQSLFGELVQDPNEPNCAITKKSFHSLTLKADLKTHNKSSFTFSYSLRHAESTNPLLEAGDTIYNKDIGEGITRVVLTKDENQHPTSFRYKSHNRKSITCLDLKEVATRD